jgi:hypothetical protein
VAKQFATWGLNQVLGCTNLTLAPTGSQINKQVQVVLVKLLQPTHQLNNVACKSTHKNLIALQSQRAVLNDLTETRAPGVKLAKYR